MTAASATSKGFWGGPTHRVILLVVVALLVVAFGPTLVEVVTKWKDQPEYSHGFLMPLVAAWMVWERRAEFGRLAPRASFVGGLLLLPCVGLLLVGEVALFEVVKPYAFVGALAAILWAFYGRTSVRVAIAPLVALFLMCPLPRSIVDGMTVPLRGSAALLATGMLDLTGIRATLDGNLISLPGLEQLFVADACSGINSLISLGSLAIIVCLVWRRHWAVASVVLLSCIPIAILTNALRIWLTGFLSVQMSPETAKGVFHNFQGMALFGVGLVFLWGWTTLIGRAFPARLA